MAHAENLRGGGKGNAMLVQAAALDGLRVIDNAFEVAAERGVLPAKIFEDVLERLAKQGEVVFFKRLLCAEKLRKNSIIKPVVVKIARHDFKNGVYHHGNGNGVLIAVHARAVCRLVADVPQVKIVLGSEDGDDFFDNRENVLFYLVVHGRDRDVRL